MLFGIDKGIFRDFLKENCPPWPYLRQLDSHTGVRFSLLIECDCIGAATNFFAVSSSFHVIVDPPDTTIDGMLVHSFYRLRFLARCVCHGPSPPTSCSLIMTPKVGTGGCFDGCSD
jgi:hypothetical protein